MTKTLNPSLQDAQSSEVTTLCTCWKIERLDGREFGFTDHTNDLVISGLLYKAESGFDPTNIETSLELNVDTTEADGVVGLGTDDITLRDVLAGLWDGAKVLVFQVDYTDVNKGVMTQRGGWMGEVSVTGKSYKADVRGLMQALQQQIGRIQTVSCNWDFGDSDCRVDLLNYTYSGTIVALGSSTRDFYMEVDSFLLGSPTLPLVGLPILILRAIELARVRLVGVLVGGKITFTSGLNAGLSMEVKSHDYISGGTHYIGLQIGMPFEVQVGDAFTVSAGCDKSWETCQTLYGNLVNFGGFPDIPGLDRLAVQPKAATQS